MNLSDISPYDCKVKEWLTQFQPEMWMHLENVPSLPDGLAQEILRYFVKLACEGQNIRPITIGREAISEMPREWVLLKIEEIAIQNLALDDEWEFRRLLELYSQLDGDLVQRLVKVGLESKNPGVVETAQDFAD